MAKLVRDRIPEIIKSKGKLVVIHKASEEEYKVKLREKLQEEVDEFLESEDEEELADILEVIEAICSFKKIDRRKLERKRLKKKEERGGFYKRIILDEAE